jgi:hypothetical protein
MHRHRQWFSGQRRLVDHRLLAHHESVHRHHLARSHQHDISLEDIVD